jgi:hypothetical protein
MWAGATSPSQEARGRESQDTGALMSHWGIQEAMGWERRDTPEA